ncbi:terminase [Paenibacillus odorifer]|uniref:Terminase n=1 Tax=Paenibacillus odorifer TaxID=189426 RepID=A0A1R0XBA3_9BACL|nr:MULTISPECIES: P27 family phage terminase small subunit [Paenibacillus]ETT61247.1 phage terminase, small subunit, P27 family protein [Paenibacillus sp. FSL H8-237]OMD32214.1 terminase [Paenibacillus odorifer]OME46768.1 terminase [Paenibacillus odorifer]
MGRNAMPVDLQIAKGNPNNLTKEEIRQRKEAEVKLGKTDLDKLRPPSLVKTDAVALGHWKQALKEYKEAAKAGSHLLTSSDVGLLAMYCRTYSEYEKLLLQYQTIENIKIDTNIFEEYFDHAEEVEGIELKALVYLSQLASLEGVLKIETAINKKMDMLLKMQDRLFLNPSSKVKNVPQPKKTQEKASKFSRFGNRSG